jgi:hypothetical protein
MVACVVEEPSSTCAAGQSAEHRAPDTKPLPDLGGQQKAKLNHQRLKAGLEPIDEVSFSFTEESVEQLLPAPPRPAAASPLAHQQSTVRVTQCLVRVAVASLLALLQLSHSQRPCTQISLFAGIDSLSMCH